jgi:HAD superfamily hydrolase (TIGR01509 family)
MSLLFDLDGTLVKTDNIYLKVWSEILLEYNIELTPYIFENYIQGNSDKYALERLQINTTSDISKQKDLLFNKYINEIEIIDGACTFIKKYKKLGYSICIVTNCNRETCINILKHLNIYKYIHYIVIGNECNHPKPYPDPYIKAISLLGTTPDKCIIFEDSKPGFISAMNVFPKHIIGINNGTNENILKELDIKIIITNYNLELEQITQIDICSDIKKMIYNSLKCDIKNIVLDTTKLKGGYISDVIKVSIECNSGEIIDTVLKYENNYTSSLTKMAYALDLFDREYYFYESISNYININIPKYIGTIKDSNFVSKGILLENINKDGFVLGLDLNKESIDVSLKVISECAKFHSIFWNKDLSKSFRNLKKHNDPLFNPSWNNFIVEKWPVFRKKWENIIKPATLCKLESIVERFNSIQEYVSINNLTLCHGDVKSGNIFYKDGYIPYFIDWQYIANGKGVQDIVFFIIESFNIYTIEKYSDICKQYYYIKLKEYGVYYSIEDYNKDFEYAICYFPFFVAIWFGTTPTDELIDVSFPFVFIQKLLYFIEKYVT